MSEKFQGAAFIAVDAGVRYWEDATVNGTEDGDGTLIPFRKGDRWKPVIRIADGVIIDWPAGAVASIHYKVCDDGNYQLLDEHGGTVARRDDDHVPDCLSPKERGYGDYIILDVDGDGKIDGWGSPTFDADEWAPGPPLDQPLSIADVNAMGPSGLFARARASLARAAAAH